MHYDVEMKSVPEGPTVFDIPAYVNVLGDHCFAGCRNLKKIVIPQNITRIGESCFYGSDVRDVYMFDSVEYIDEQAFDGCSELRNIRLSSSIDRIYANTFRSCEKLARIYIPSGVTQIDDNAFQSCSSLKEVSIPDSVDTIGNDVFAFCSKLKVIRLSQAITRLPDIGLGYLCSPDIIKIWSSTVSIEEHVFYRTPNITIVTTAGSVAEAYAKKMNLKVQITSTVE